MGRRRGNRFGLTPHQQRKLDQAFDRADREDALRKEHGRCHYCRTKLTIRTVTRDHVDPRALGGSNQRKNIVAACERCNVAKGSMPYKQFVRMIRFPEFGDPVQFWLINMDLRINKALQKMERGLAKALGIDRI